MDINAIVIQEIEQVLAKKTSASQKRKVETNDRLFSRELGLDSLDFAELIVRLEEKLGVDPFKELGARLPLQSVGDLILFYQQHSPQKNE